MIQIRTLFESASTDPVLGDTLERGVLTALPSPPEDPAWFGAVGPAPAPAPAPVRHLHLVPAEEQPAAVKPDERETEQRETEQRETEQRETEQRETEQREREHRELVALLGRERDDALEAHRSAVANVAHTMERFASVSTAREDSTDAVRVTAGRVDEVENEIAALQERLVALRTELSDREAEAARRREAQRAVAGDVTAAEAAAAAATEDLAAKIASFEAAVGGRLPRP